MFTRRALLKGSGVALAWDRSANALPAAGKTLVVLFLRGGVDALNMIVPHGDPLYYRMRPGIAIPRAEVIDLDGYFGLHPALAPLAPSYREGRFATVVATGSPLATHSHIDAQSCVETGIPGGDAAAASWWNRAFQTQETFTAASDIGPGLRQIAHRINSRSGLKLAATRMDGWDHHMNQSEALSGQLHTLAQSLAAFDRDLGNHRDDVIVMTMSEFGRSAQENADRGTGHGHGSAMLVLGSGVKGGRIHGRWPGLRQEQLHKGRDLAVTTDFRDVLGELVSNHLGQRDLENLFPNFTPKRETWSLL